MAQTAFTVARRWSRLAPLLGLLALGACKSPRIGPDPATLPGLHIDDILAASPHTTSREIRELERLWTATSATSRASSEAIQLRLAALLERVGELERAEHHVNAVLGGPRQPTPRAEAIAWYLRARIREQQGQVDKARSCLAQAEATAVDRASRRRITRAMNRIGRAEPESRAAPQAPRSRQRVTLVHRRDWGARAPIGSRLVPMGRMTRITIHHSALREDGSSTAALRHVHAFQTNHIDQRRWGDIGYHFLIDRGGRVIEGRSLRYQGAHAGNGVANKGNVGVCLLGNFEPGTAEPSQQPSQRQLASLEVLVESLTRLYAIPPRHIYTHKDVHPNGPGATDCPGRTMIPYVAGLRARLIATDLAAATK